MRIRQVFSSAFATWYIGMALFLLLFVPTLEALMFVLKCLVWLLRAWQAVSHGNTAPSWDELFA